jgi:branched-chain amino acid transport system ATP-binding protein
MSTTARNLETNGVTMAFAGVKAVDDVSLRLARGEICGLIGPNGAGKTTLLNVLSGFVRPISGSVRLEGRDITRWRADRRARAGLVRTFQGTRVFPAFTVYENVELAGLAMGLRPGPVRERTLEVLTLFGLEARADQPANTLPQGTERLVGLARAVAALPDFLMLDEPAAGLDDNETAHLGQNLELIRATYGMGILLVEHDVELVMSVCDRIHVLAMGRSIAEGSPEEIADDLDVQTAYLGTKRSDTGIHA